MKFSLLVPKNVTLAFSYNNKTEVYCRLCHDSRLWRPRSQLISRQHYGAPSLPNSQTSQIKAAHSITV